ncbi:hypothetical protein ACFE04_006104 [Oxalis oulophora]
MAMAAMEAFKDGLANPQLLNWPDNNGDDPCGPPTWPHLSCSGDRVRRIEVKNLGLGGTLPQNFNHLSKIVSLSLQGNNFTGSVPSFAGLSELKYAYLGRNRFDTITSDFFQGLVNIKSLTLNHNCFNAPTGWSLPHSLNYSLQLVYLSCVNCNIVGPLPSFLGSLVSLKVLKLSRNRIVGGIPTTFGDSKLHTLWLNDQGSGGMNGTVEVISKMTELRTLQLQGNRFTSTIPEKQDHNTKFNIMPGIPVIAVALAGGLFLILGLWDKTVSKFKEKMSSKGQTDNKNEENDWSNVVEADNMIIKLRCIEKMTKNFSKENELASDYFGTVYTGELKNRTVAVKRLSKVCEAKYKAKELEIEVYRISKVQHRHIVALLGFCIGKRVNVLVYEHMPRGTLRNHLQHTNDSSLTWEMRLSIALDVAEAINYLHRFASNKIIYQRLNSYNILLDRNYRAKISDVGLVNFISGREHSISAYYSPQYKGGEAITTKDDVYSFGILLLEILSGKDMSRDLVDDRLPRITSEEEIKIFIDPAMNSRDLKSISKVARLAVICTLETPNARPNIGSVAYELSLLVAHNQEFNTLHEVPKLNKESLKVGSSTEPEEPANVVESVSSDDADKTSKKSEKRLSNEPSSSGDADNIPEALKKSEKRLPNEPSSSDDATVCFVNPNKSKSSLNEPSSSDRGEVPELLKLLQEISSNNILEQDIPPEGPSSANVPLKLKGKIE